MMRSAVVLLAVVSLGACGKKPAPASTHDDAAVTAPTRAPEAPALPADAAVAAPPIATHVTPPPPPSTKFGHFCAKLPTGYSRCAITEAECKTFGPRCGEWKSVFCFMQPSGAQCFPSPEDCKTAHDNAVHRSEPVTADCVQDEM